MVLAMTVTVGQVCLEVRLCSIVCHGSGSVDAIVMVMMVMPVSGGQVVQCCAVKVMR